MLQHNKKNDKAPNTFVDGVPVKISEQYKPPRKITLPVSCQNCSQSESLYTEYDFRLENSVLGKLVEWKKTRQEEVERRKERLKGMNEVCQDLENFNNLTLKEDKVVDEGAEPARQFCNPTLDNSILTPVCAKVNSPSNKPPSSLFNLSDFESDNSSPFDNMELKTINEMEVLASILTSDNMKQSFNNNCNVIDKELNKNGLAFSKNTDWGPPAQNGYDNYVLSSYNGTVTPAGYLDGYGPVNSGSENFQFYNFEHNNFSNQCGAGVSSGPTSSVRNVERHQLDDGSVGRSDGSYGRKSPSCRMPRYLVGCRDEISRCLREPTGSIPTSTENLAQDTSHRSGLDSHRSTSKSVPDIVNELQRELDENRERDLAAERRIRTPPPGPDTQKQLPESSKSGKSSPRQLPDPTTNLSSELRRLSQHISEMGFPLPRVARACAFFEGDDKKVIEFLLQVQSLEEKNFPGDLVERALYATNMEIEEAVKFLNCMLVLLDLGFDESKVEEALKKTNSDRDKALDLLIS